MLTLDPENCSLTFTAAGATVAFLSGSRANSIAELCCTARGQEVLLLDVLEGLLNRPHVFAERC